MAKTFLTNLLLFFLFFFHNIEGHPKRLFINNSIIIVLHKLHQYEQHHFRGKGNSIPLELKTEPKNKTISMLISRLVQIISQLIMSLVDYTVDY